MKKILLIVATTLAFSANAMGESACTNQLSGYYKGLTLSLDLPATKGANRERAELEIKTIDTLRKSKDDCEIIEEIPALKASRDALKRATQR